MINPIHKVLSTLQACRVQNLLMGGQACILYGGAEFSRDVDLTIVPSPENLERLKNALEKLDCTVIAVPPFEAKYLLQGHAVHFRCRHPEARDLRLDVMAVMRGLDPFDVMWKRRTTIRLDADFEVDLIALPDLIKAKKTQRDKDWPMIRRLIEADYALASADTLESNKIQFWLKECRTPLLLIELSARHPELAAEGAKERSLLVFAQQGDESALERALAAEELNERELDRQYWRPLRSELEKMRHDFLR